jgi:3D (Asp-Asp-Asp) domain-containing protein
MEELYDAKFTPASTPNQTPANPYAPYDQPIVELQPGQNSTEYDIEVTAYDNCKLCTGKSPGDPGYGITRSGFPAAPGAVAVDRNYYPFGTRFEIPGYGAATAVDTGGAIKGPFRLDAWFSTHRQAIQFGRQVLPVKVYYPPGHVPRAVSPWRAP